MGIYRFIAAISAISLLTLTGAGCRGADRSPTKSIIGGGSARLQVTGGERDEQVLQALVEQVFGSVQPNSIVRHPTIDASLSVQFTVGKNAGRDDITTMSDTLKKSGYASVEDVVIEEGIMEGTAYVSGVSRKHYVIISFVVGQPHIIAMAGPVELLDKYRDDSSL